MSRPGHLSTGSRWITGFFIFLVGSIVFQGPYSPALSDPAEDLILGEACFMAGDFVCAGERLEGVVESGQAGRVERALYLLGRIHLITGDFRQSKEFFERAAEGDPGYSVRWMALVGIGDALFGAARHEEAIRRYRFALSEIPPDVDGAVVQVKIALCRYHLGRHREASALLGEALTRIQPLSGWIGREEDFLRSMSMMEMGPSPLAGERFFITIGPVEGDPNLEDIVGPEIPMRRIREGGGDLSRSGPSMTRCRQ